MKDVIAPKWSSLKPGLIETSMFLKMNMSLILYNPGNVAESPIWNTLIPPRPKLPYDIHNTNDNENEEDDEDDNLSPMPIKSEETDYTC